MRVSPEFEACDGVWVLLNIVFFLVHHDCVYKDDGAIIKTYGQYLEVVVKILQLNGSNFVREPKDLASLVFLLRLDMIANILHVSLSESFDFFIVLRFRRDL